MLRRAQVRACAPARGRSCGISIPSGLVALTLLAVLGLAGLTLALGQKAAGERRDATRGWLDQTARGIAAALGRELAEPIAVLELLSGSTLIDRHDWAELRRLAAGPADRRAARSIFLVDQDRATVFDSGRSPGPPLPDLAPETRRRVDAVFESAKPVALSLSPGAGDARALEAYVPVVREGQVRYVLGMRMPVAGLRAALAGAAQAAPAEVRLLDSSGAVVAEARDASPARPLSPSEAGGASPAGAGGVSEVVLSDGSRGLRAVAAVAPIGWTVAATIPAEGPGLPLSAHDRTWLAGAVLIVLLAPAIAWFAGRRIASAVGAMTERVAAAQPAAASALESGFSELRALDAALTRAEQEHLAQVQRLKSRTQLAQQPGSVGFLEREFRGEALRCSEGMSRLLGIQPFQAPKSWDEWMGRVVPGDAAALNERVACCLVDRQERFEHDFRVRRPDGSIRWLAWRARIEFDSAGAPVQMAGVAFDVTDLKRAQEELRRSEAKFRAFMDHTPLRAWIADEAGRLVFLNRAARGAHGAGEPVGRTFRELYPIETAERMEKANLQVLESGAPLTSVEQMADGTRMREYLTVRFPIRAEGARYVGGTAIDLTDQRSAERALEEADRQKDLFLSALARALRNPLAPIRNALSLQRRDDLPADMVGWTAGIIESEVGRMARLIDELLDMSRITRNRLILKLGRVRLNEVVERAVAACRAQAVEEREQTLAVSMPSEEVELNADSARLEQALALVLRYAARNAAAGADIRLEARVAGGVAMVAVRFRGAPLKEEDSERLFDIFHQRAGTSPDVGLDVELPLARELIRLHGGSLTVLGDPEAAGNRLEIRLPVQSVAVTESARQNGGVAEVLPMGPRRRVLIADDSLRTASSLAMILRMSGHEVRTAANGEEAVDAVAGFLPDVAFLDIDMPKMNGYEAAQRIRERMREASPLLVAVTSWGDDDSRERAIAAGFDLHYTKPVDPNQMLRLLAAPPRSQEAAGQSADQRRTAGGG